MKRNVIMTLAALMAAGNRSWAAGTIASNDLTAYPDGHPSAMLPLNANEQGIVLKYGEGPGGCDRLNAYDVWMFESAGQHHIHYDGAGPKGWLYCPATTANLEDWAKRKPVLEVGKTGEPDFNRIGNKRT